MTGDVELSEGTIALLVHDFTNPFFTDVARSIGRSVGEAGFAFALAESRGSAERELATAWALVEAGVDGLVLTPAADDPDHLAAIDELGIPTVLMGATGDSGRCAVAVDDIRGGQLAAEHLLDAGHEQLVILTGPPAIESLAHRIEGFRGAVADAGLDPDEAVTEVVVPLASSQEGKRALARVLAPEPTAVFCANDLLALGLLRALAGRGVSVPDDVAVMGYDDVDFAHTLPTPLTTIRQPTRELGHECAQLIVDELTSRRHRHRVHELEPQLVARASTGT